VNKYLIIIIFLFIVNIVLSQQKEYRIKEIKKMYAELNSLISLKKECIYGKKIEHEGFDENSEKYPFDQMAESCKLSNNYKTLSASFNGYEWNCNMSYYLNNDIPFFVLMSTGAEGCISEYRIYLDKNGEIIQLLEKSNECDGNTPLINKEIQDLKQIDNIKNIIIQNRVKIDDILQSSK